MADTTFKSLHTQAYYIIQLACLAAFYLRLSNCFAAIKHSGRDEQY
jgi:hypothetical protein